MITLNVAVHKRVENVKEMTNSRPTVIKQNKKILKRNTRAGLRHGFHVNHT